MIDISKELAALGGTSRVSPCTSSAGSPAAPGQQDSETHFTRPQSQDPVGSMMPAISQQLYHVEEIPSMAVQPNETSTAPQVTMNYSQPQTQEWNVDSAPGPSVAANYDQLPQGTNADHNYVGYGSQDWTNQLLGLFTSENDSAGFVTNMTYPDPPATSSTHASWETFFSYMLQS